MWRRWFFLSALVPVLTFASAGCLFAGADAFVADAAVKAEGTRAPIGLVYIRFKYDTREGKTKMKGHFADPAGFSAAGTGVFLKFQKVVANSPTAGSGINSCMGAAVSYVPEDPNHPIYGDIVDANGQPVYPGGGTLLIDACDNNHDSTLSVGDTLDSFQVLDGKFAAYTISGIVADGKFECKSPEPACDRDL